ncbi:uncharacterized protein LAESUDRAFT_658373 [Laetiporus sulphureus 93-53]|uniref:Uncharacterized protein n=1 Tax=Laetiporus sulphureus 93-53 TaxID=1314785 RepID=A0A165D343_9APHY|nr:uncharacterized protein LAESUDRAFT_658373 [Laetiporus sulphureus 93-53]KZT04062.1 hypothetical protein LAESUDRAFT_658373 [Laetiporus sulphureus 93-53]
MTVYPMNCNCNYCDGLDHFMSCCPHVDKDIKAGKVYRDKNGRIRLPDGGYVLRALPGNNMWDRVNSWYSQHLGSSVPGAVQSAATPQSRDKPPHQVNILEEVRKVNMAVIDESRVMDRTEHFTSRGVLASQSTYGYRTPIEDKKNIPGIVRKILDLPVMVTIRELIQHTPELQKHLKELITLKRVAMTAWVKEVTDEDEAGAGEKSVFLTASKTMLPTKGSLPLWVVEPIIKDTLQCECILDQGVQICVMQEDVWKDLRAPLNPDGAILLETANTSVMKTVRKLPCVQLQFSSVIIAVQVQVMHHMSFEILLGWPFFATAVCETRDFASGEQQITITDPHSGERVVVPTKVWTVQREVDPNLVGFHGSMNWV